MRSHARAAPFIESAVSFDRFQLLFACERNAVQGCHFVERPILRPFHARAVVTEDVNNEGVVGEGPSPRWLARRGPQRDRCFPGNRHKLPFDAHTLSLLPAVRCPTRGTPGYAQ